MIPELAKLLESSVQENLEDRTAVAFSGGIDSTVIACVAKKSSETGLFSAGTEESIDLKVAEEVSKIIELDLKKGIMGEEEILETYKKCKPVVPTGDLLKIEILVPVYKTAELARNAGQEILLFGSGAEELFVGYDRYYGYMEEGKDIGAILNEEYKTLENREISWIKKVCWKFDIEARFPYYNRKLSDFVFSLPLETRIGDRDLKKNILRDAGKMLGVPDVVLKRRKKAMQYGSGIHRIIMKHSDEL